MRKGRLFAGFSVLFCVVYAAVFSAFRAGRTYELALVEAEPELLASDGGELKRPTTAGDVSDRANAQFGQSVLVTDSLERAIAGAVIFQGSLEDARSISATELGTVGVTDENGLCRIEGSPVEQPLTAFARGFLPGPVLSDMVDGNRVVRLQSGCTLVVTCVDQDGVPVPDRWFMASDTSLPNVHLTVDPSWELLLPNPLHPTPVYYGCSDSRGQVHFTGLAPGLYSVRPAQFDYVCIKRSQMFDVQQQHQTGDLVLGRVYAGALLIEGDLLAGMSFGLPDSMSSGYGELTTVMRHMLDRWTDCVPICAVSTYPAGETLVEIEMLLHSAGSVVVPIALRPFDLSLEPTVFDASGLRSKYELDACVVVIEDGHGHLLGGLGLSLVGNGSAAPIENGEICYVRTGQYRLVSKIPWIDKSLGLRSVQVPGNYHASLEQRLECIRAGVRVGEERYPDNFSLNVEVRGSTMSFAGPGGTDVNLVVPAEAEVLLSASAAGYKPATAVFHASGVNEDGCFWISLEPE